MPTEASLPIEDLPQLIDEIEKLLDNIVDDWSPVLFVEDIREHLRNAWSEVKGTVYSIRLAITDPINSSALVQAGLSGEQLRLKLKVITDAWQNFKSKGTVELLGLLLGVIDVVLGSLASAIQVGEALKEFKEIIEKLLE